MAGREAANKPKPVFMQILLFWLCILGTVLAYSVIGSMLMACVVFYIKAGIKIKIAMAHYGHLLGFILLASIVFYFLSNTVIYGFWWAAIIGVSLRYIFTTRRYATNVVFNDNTISVYYITNWFKAKHLDFTVTDNNSVQLGELKNWFDCLPKLKIKEGDAEITFYVVDKHIHEQVKACVDNHHAAIALA